MNEETTIPDQRRQVEPLVRQLPLVLPDDDGIRPAGKPDECFYCHEKVGSPHKYECVILNRRVKVRYIFEIETEMPYSWDAGNIDFKLNESSWCANNAIDDIQRFSDELDEQGSCLCHCFRGETIEVPQAKPYRYNKDQKAVA